MKKEELQERIEKVIGKGDRFGLKVFAVLKEREKLSLKKFLITDELREHLEILVKEEIKTAYIAEEIKLETIDNILDESPKTIYEIEISEAFDPLSCVDDCEAVKKQYDQNDSHSLFGFLFRLNIDDTSVFYAFQQVYSVTKLDRKRSIYAYLSRDKAYEEIKKDIISIRHKIDMLILDGHIITGNIGMLESKFGFDKVVRKKAKDTIEMITEAGFVSNIEVLVQASEDSKLTIAKKLMHASNMPVIKMEKEELIKRVCDHPRYSKVLKIDNGSIKIENKTDIKNFLKLLNDDIVKSELTDVEYDSVSKKTLEPMP